MYKSTAGTRWAFMRLQHIRDLLDRSSIYLTRLRVVETPWFAIYVHAIHRPDNDRHMHDHPWSFVSIILRGGYDELYAPTALSAGRAAALGVWDLRTWRAGSIHRMSRGQFHSIRQLHRRPTWTLLLVGRRRGDWGYATEGGWVQHEDYHHERNPAWRSRSAS